ncbi:MULTISPECIES: hypothetical protein [Prochlorococcus]|uniref:hypothetical protein n=1 Tax=Prochlorococcus TaxID=1218 RepID=UPI000533B194|nr:MULTISPECIES: hypothetical protein [Prochlorococcus]KGG13051.1 hypothetical protein EV05_0725 [Prochlorococcus sp. MIT 0601]
MTIKRPNSNKKPGDQSAQTPSGKEVPMAMSMMVDSMVRMIQQGSHPDLRAGKEKALNTEDED